MDTEEQDKDGSAKEEANSVNAQGFNEEKV